MAGDANGGGSEPVGEVTSALWSPRLKKNIGYAMAADRAGTADGSSVTVAAPEGERPATVVPMPFIDPGKEIPKS